MGGQERRRHRAPALHACISFPLTLVLASSFLAFSPRHVAAQEQQASPPLALAPGFFQVNMTESASEAAAADVASAPSGPYRIPSASSGGVAADLATQAFQHSELPCIPQDFARAPTTCAAGATTRAIEYNVMRPCEAAFQVTPHTEPCGCRPDDFSWSYQKVSLTFGGEECMKIYKCVLEEVGKVKVDMLYCADQLPVCTADMLETLYGKCDYIRDKKSGQKISEKQAVEVIYYFGKSCDSNGYGAYKPPASAFIPCNTACGSGSYLSGTTCKLCPAGTYSLGGLVRYDHFESVDPTVFKKSCTYKKPLPGTTSATETLNCTQGWYAEDGALEVGQFDYVNQWFPDECEADSNKDCHNNLNAVLSMDVDLVTDGFVTFNFSVNAEKGHDGLSFYIDTLEEAILGLQSYEPVPRSVIFGLTAGRHTLFWIYSKDGHFTQGEDIAIIHSIEISGMALNAFKCTPCPKGMFSKEGAGECEVCPPNSIAPQEGTAKCLDCPDTEYSVSLPRVVCVPRQPCNLTRDFVKVVSACKASANTQSVVWKQTLPVVCTGGDTAPPPKEEPCEACKPGFHAVKTPDDQVLVCRPCPLGQARRADQAECETCPSGTYAERIWTMKGFDFQTAHYPPGMTSYCHGACGTSGWRRMTDYIDSGRHHGDGTQVFLSLDMMLSSDGSIFFNYSTDMSAGPKKRGFFFYIDDNIIDFVQDDEGGSITPNAVRESGPWELKAGPHKFVWEWMRITGDAPAAARDNTIIYDILIKGSTGYATGCEPVPPGYYLNAEYHGIEMCAAGSYSEGGADSCSLCAENSISKRGSSECTPCPAGTTSKSGDADCFIGSVNDIASFCSYFDTSNAPSTFENVTDIIQYYFYDLSPLSRLSTSTPFGPIREFSAEPGESSAYYINICNRNLGNSTCRDLSGNSLNTYACLVHAEVETQVGHRPAVDLGRSVGVHSLAENGKGLGGRGVVLSFEGEICPKTAQPRKLNITLICSPQSGYGVPTHWTSDGKRAAFDVALDSPSEWVVRTGAALPIEDKATCFHDMVWYSKIACHECTWNDYEEVRVNDCKDNKMYTYRWKENLACLPTEKAPLPSDIICQPCTASDYVVQEGTCTDLLGNHNRTFFWTQPKVCSSALEGAVPLPENVVAGPCIQEFLFVPSSYLSPKYVFVFALLGVGVVVMLIIWLVAYIKHRRIQQFYSKLVQTEEQMTEMVDFDDEDEHPTANGEGAHLQR